MAVSSPLIVSPKEENAPQRSPRSMAAAVPTAWLAVPMERDPAMGLFILDNLAILNPTILPKIPVQTTTAAVSGAIPPRVDAISNAIGVVTDFGANEKQHFLVFQ